MESIRQRTLDRVAHEDRGGARDEVYTAAEEDWRPRDEVYTAAEEDWRP